MLFVSILTFWSNIHVIPSFEKSTSQITLVHESETPSDTLQSKLCLHYIPNNIDANTCAIFDDIFKFEEISSRSLNNMDVYILSLILKDMSKTKNIKIAQNLTQTLRHKDFRNSIDNVIKTLGNPSCDTMKYIYTNDAINDLKSITSSMLTCLNVGNIVTTRSAHHETMISLTARVISAIFSWILLFSTSFIGLILIPLKNKRRIRYIFIQTAYAMGYAGLVGEAVFHLIPHGLLGHEHHSDHSHNDHSHHDHSHHDHSHNDSTHSDANASGNHAHHSKAELVNLAIFLLGIIGFYFVEVLLKVCPFTRDHNCGCHEDKVITSSDFQPSVIKENVIESNSCQHSPLDNHDCINTETAHDIRKTSAQHRLGAGVPPDVIVDLDYITLTPCRGDINDESNVEVVIKQNKSSPNCATTTQASNIVLLLLLGDAAHNFFDGIAIGCIFISSKYSYREGIAATIAIIFHELPHKIGDVALLLKSGYSEIKATFLVATTSVSSLIGMVVGLVLSYKFESLQAPINLFTAGMFLYMGLVLMMSQMLNAISNPEFSLKLVVACHFAGIVTGISIMVAIAFYEGVV